MGLSANDSRLQTNYSDGILMRVFVKGTRLLIFVAVGLLSTAGGFTGDPANAHIQSTLSKVAYFEFLFVIMALTSMCLALYARQRHAIKQSQHIVSSRHEAFILCE